MFAPLLLDEFLAKVSNLMESICVVDVEQEFTLPFYHR
jgi:hypothetical protein